MTVHEPKTEGIEKAEQAANEAFEEYSSFLDDFIRRIEVLTRLHAKKEISSHGEK